MFGHDVVMENGSTYRVTRLLAGGTSNVKIGKSDKAGLDIVTKSLSLAPHKASGFNLCTSASHACIADCIYTSGLAGVFPRTIQPSRIAKSRWLRLDPVTFRERLESELAHSVKTARHKGLKLAVRLNVFSDVMWEREMPGIFDAFPQIQFYDYTKHYKRMLRYINGDLASNYHLTFSWSGKNELQCLDVLAKGHNVAVPFRVTKSKPLPTEFLGSPVINGDEHDLRFKDDRNVIVGLRAKGKARKDHNSGFVVSL